MVISNPREVGASPLLQRSEAEPLSEAALKCQVVLNSGHIAAIAPVFGKKGEFTPLKWGELSLNKILTNWGSKRGAGLKGL